jgi:flagellar basal-body rod protein FlgB
MASSLLDSVDRLRVGLDYHLARHNVLVSNLAHVDTPGYRPVDLERVEFAGALEQAMKPEGAPQGTFAFEVVDDPTAAAGPDGNGVDVDREAVKIATNQMRYGALAQLASSELAGLDYAVGDARSGG